MDRALERALDLDRLEVEKGVGLHERPRQTPPATDDLAACRGATAEDDQDAVGGQRRKLGHERQRLTRTAPAPRQAMIR